MVILKRRYLQLLRDQSTYILLGHGRIFYVNLVWMSPFTVGVTCLWVGFSSFPIISAVVKSQWCVFELMHVVWMVRLSL